MRYTVADLQVFVLWCCVSLWMILTVPLVCWHGILNTGPTVITVRSGLDLVLAIAWYTLPFPVWVGTSILVVKRACRCV